MLKISFIVSFLLSAFFLNCQKEKKDNHVGLVLLLAGSQGGLTCNYQSSPGSDVNTFPLTTASRVLTVISKKMNDNGYGGGIVKGSQLVANDKIVFSDYGDDGIAIYKQNECPIAGGQNMANTITDITQSGSTYTILTPGNYFFYIFGQNVNPKVIIQ
ncbi:hypothetical protein EHQ23_13715 [Leptospira bourretii]|uniref:Uncharacterized protein n=1 Tax=Leptospira bourretii TaxID=2484962 RepID=A0A4R9ISY2_9LEPT|nr:hypothetical protein [Leptospira bourretii]TGK85686.1 hypothetical protein EHQ23_13715 [Leptospira bourretii]TGK94582.1 hypothetical protein EHQ26_01145 [Leptospira bourretii]TGL38225.1 hypothetical protein EHQ45_05355 [Leptospira bourretii]